MNGTLLRLLATAATALCAAAALAVTPLQGHWRIEGAGEPDQGAVIAFEPVSTGHYRVVSLYNVNVALTPGTVIGSARVTDTANSVYTVEMCTDTDRKGCPVRKRTFKATVTAPGQLELEAVKGSFNTDVWMLYRFFFTVSLRHNRQPEAIHAVRVGPEWTPTPEDPLIL